jgi:hypothetical protein
MGRADRFSHVHGARRPGPETNTDCRRGRAPRPSRLLAPAADRTDDIVSGGTRIRRMRLCLLRCSDGRGSRAALSPSC